MSERSGLIWRLRARLLVAAAAALLAVAVLGAGSAWGDTGFGVKQMRLPKRGATLYKDRTAPGGRAVVLSRRLNVSLGSARFGAARLGVWARTRECRGPARVRVSVDGRRRLDVPVQKGPWKQYSALVALRPGLHRVTVGFPNPRRSGGCVRLLRVGKVTFSSTAQKASEGERLVFDDEFDGTQVDQSKWNTSNWKARSGFYDPGNVLVQNGMLRLRASAANRSGMAQTLGKFQATYGRVDAAIRLPRGQGFWPAFWLKTAAVPLITNPEIDVLENWETDRPDDLNDPYTISQNYHWADANGQAQSDHSWVRGSTDYTAGFHRFSVDWRPGLIRWFIDGVETKQVKGPMVSRVPMFVVFSLQIGHADWLGSDFEVGPTTPFPSYMDVDYIRVYQG
jgi:beta-glucanase (GH16 family)